MRGLDNQNPRVDSGSINVDETCGACARFLPDFFPYGKGTCIAHLYLSHPMVAPCWLACERFRPVGIRYTSELVVRMDAPANEHREKAWDLSVKYGLGSWYSLDTVQLIWEHYSESFACGWVGESPETIERVFGVLLKVKGQMDAS